MRQLERWTRDLQWRPRISFRAYPDTQAPVALLGARSLKPPAVAAAYDLTCGSGGLLLQLRDEAFRLHGDEAQDLTLYGQELEPTTWAIGRMDMLLHGASAAATIEQGDTLFKPAFVQSGRVRQFDLITANPPFSSSNWGHDRLKLGGDPFGWMRHGAVFARTDAMSGGENGARSMPAG